MKETRTGIIVITGDIVRSGDYDPGARRLLQKELLRGWATVQRQYLDGLKSRFQFRVTAGDEFQYVCRNWKTALNSLTLLRLIAKTVHVEPRVLIRASIANGTASITGSADSYTWDGPAFRRAREGMDKLKRSRRLTALQTGAANPCGQIVDLFLPALDLIYDHWTAAQAGVLRLVMEGLSTEKILKKLSISRPTLSIHLRRAAWAEYQAGFEGTLMLLAAPRTRLPKTTKME